MISISDEAKRRVIQDERRKIIRIEWEDTSIRNLTNADIKQESLSFTESLNSGESFKFGGGELCVLEFEAYNLPNVKNKVFNAYMDIELGADYAGSTTNTRLVDGIRYAVFRLGRYIVHECKKNAKMARYVSRKIEAYSYDLVDESIVKQLDNLYSSTYEHEKVFVDMSGLLQINDKLVSSYSRNLVTKGNVSSQLIHMTTVVQSSSRYQVSVLAYYYDSFYETTKQDVFEVEKLSKFYDYDSAETKARVKNTIDKVFLNYMTASQISQNEDINLLKYKIDNQLDQAGQMMSYSTPMYWFGYRKTTPDDTASYMSVNDGLWAMPWFYLEISVSSASGSTKKEKVYFFEDEQYGISSDDGMLHMYKLTFGGYIGELKNLYYYLNKPKQGEYNEWMNRLRKSTYELEARFSNARNDYKTFSVSCRNGLVPSVGLYPRTGLRPSTGLGTGVEKAYAEADVIKSLLTDDEVVKFKAIRFEWNNFADEGQSFTWNMLEDISNLQYFSSSAITISKSLANSNKQIVLKFNRAISSNIAFFDTLRLSDENLIAEAYKDDVKLFTIMDRNTRRGGFFDSKINLSESTYQHRGNMEMYYVTGKLCNDLLVGMNKIIVYSKDGKTLSLDNANLNAVYDYICTGSNKSHLKYINDGNAYVVGSDNLIMSDGNLDGFEIMYFTKRLDYALRNIQYLPYDADLRGMPYIECGDVIEMHTPYENIKSIVMRRTTQGIQSLTDNFETK